jgi:hypothetical protein
VAIDPAALFYPTADEIQDLHDTIIASTGGLAGVRVDIHGVVGRIETNLTTASSAASPRLRRCTRIRS